MNRVGMALVTVAFLLGCSAGDSDAGSDSTTREAENTTTTTEEVTTTAEPTTTTIAQEVLYAQIQVEIERACTVAVDNGTEPTIRFDDAWIGLATPEEIKAAAAECVRIETPNPDELMCADLKPYVDDWIGNITVAGEVADGVTEIRDKYRGQLSPEFQSAIDAAKSTVGVGNAGEMISPGNGLDSLAHKCNDTFATGIATL